MVSPILAFGTAGFQSGVSGIPARKAVGEALLPEHELQWRWNLAVANNAPSSEQHRHATQSHVKQTACMNGPNGPSALLFVTAA